MRFVPLRLVVHTTVMPWLLLLRPRSLATAFADILLDVGYIGMGVAASMQMYDFVYGWCKFNSVYPWLERK
jgi:hypothetical protein